MYEYKKAVRNGKSCFYISIILFIVSVCVEVLFRGLTLFGYNITSVFFTLAIISHLGWAIYEDKSRRILNNMVDHQNDLADKMNSLMSEYIENKKRT